ncbi:lysoplasmalogenase [Streptomyces sp. H27-D2]|uniref:lysoplasmalogenase n=1 Tax=Streptomyces sp. H27-D2 TaxID=3046304 RepID=UPI002DB8BB33|nr:lysoplasmalogenase [Streptomyces sp. H27-D2]MEC4017728.1 lysoplasmalogenase [Streptomyces sp. H27-D2]
MRGARAAARPLLALFALLAVVHLGALLGGAETLAHLTKPALMPVLAGYVLARGGPPLLAVALLLGCGGDSLLLSDAEPAFLVGMGSFAAGHVCYLVLFFRGRPHLDRRRTVPLAIAYAAACLGTVALLWPDLAADLRVPVAGYSLLLTGMALGATRAGLRVALGGALFLISDTLIAGRIAEWPQLPAPQFWIMLTYIAAQALLADGLLRAERPPLRVGRPVAVADEARTRPAGADHPAAAGGSATREVR